MALTVSFWMFIALWFTPIIGEGQHPTQHLQKQKELFSTAAWAFILHVELPGADCTHLDGHGPSGSLPSLAMLSSSATPGTCCIGAAKACIIHAVWLRA